MNHSILGFELQDATDGFVFEVGSLRAVLEEVGDARDPRGKRWPQVTVLLFALLAKLSGEDKLRGIAQWVTERVGWLNRVLQLPARYNRKGALSGPHATTYSRVMGKAVKVSEFEQVAQGFFSRQPRAGRAIQVTLDGKKIHGTISADNRSGVYLLAVFMPQVGLVLMQAAIHATQNELSVAPQVLECLDLQGKIVTADALFTQRNLSIQIVEAGGEYVWKVKDNQPALRADIDLLFTAQTPQPAWNVPVYDFRTVTQPDIGHGRIERRTLTASRDLRGYIDWPYAEQVFKYEYQYHELSSDKRGGSVIYGITSLTADEASADRLLQLVRGHWGIEAGLHYRRDVTLKEDACRLRVGHAAHVMAIINNLVLGLLLALGDNVPDLRRIFSAHPERALALVLQAPP